MSTRPGIGSVGRRPPRRARQEDDLAFLVEIGQSLVSARGPEELVSASAAKIAAHLELACCGFFEWPCVSANEVRFLLPQKLDPMRYGERLALLRELVSHHPTGTALVLSKVDEGLPPEQARRAALLGLGALFWVPAGAEGGFALLGYDRRPRDWQERELRLARELASRVWVALAKLRAEETLRESEEKYRNLFESIDEGFAVIELIFGAPGCPVDATILEVNPSFARILGVTEAVGRSWRELFPRLPRSFFDALARVWQGGQALRFEQRLAEPHAWLDVYASRVGSQHLKRLAIVFNDVTKRKRYEVELSLLSEVTRDLVWATTIQEATTVVGEKLSGPVNISRCLFAEVDEAQETAVVLGEWLASDQESLLGTHRLADFCTGELQATAQAGHPFVVHDLTTDPRISYPRRLTSLGPRSVLGMPILEAGRLRYMFAVYDDSPRFWRAGEVELLREVTARLWARLTRVHADEALRRAAREQRLILENLRDYALFSLDLQGRIRSWNAGAERLTGYAEEEVLGSHFRHFYLPEDQQRGRPEKELARAAREGRSESEGWRIRKDGKHLWVNEIVTVVRDSGGAAVSFVKIARDMTERRETEQARVDKEREATLLAERNRMAQELHDTLAQGFTGVKLQIELAEHALGEEPPDVEAATRHLNRALEFSRLSQADARRSIRELRSPLLEGLSLSQALRQLCEEVTDGVKVVFRKRGKAMVFPAMVQNDIYRIAQEALTNAVRHSQAKRVSVSLTFSPQRLALTVRDDGRGFDQGLSPPGFGLTGIRERVLRIGAELELSSRLGRGTRICLKVNLPRGPGTLKKSLNSSMW